MITKRGVSPRIVWARLYGTGGVTKIRGDQLAAALGGYDRWMTFRKVVDGPEVGEEPTARAPGAVGRHRGMVDGREPRSGSRQLRVDRAVVAAGQVVDAVVDDAKARGRRARGRS